MYDRREVCFRNGTETEKLFEYLMAAKGIKFRKSDSKDDMINKIDYYIGKTDTPIQIKSTPQKEDGCRCIEFIDVNGNNGWMNSKSEIIVFETNTHFLFIEIDRIWKLLSDKLSFYTSPDADFNYNNSVSLRDNIFEHYNIMRSSNSLNKTYYKSVNEYNLYTRADWDGRKRWDLCTKIPLHDLEKISKAKLIK